MGSGEKNLNSSIFNLFLKYSNPFFYLGIWSQFLIKSILIKEKFEGRRGGREVL